MLKVQRHTPVPPAVGPPIGVPKVAVIAPVAAAVTVGGGGPKVPVDKPLKPGALPKKSLDAGRIATQQGAPLDYCRLIVRNLSFEVTQEHLSQCFASFPVQSCTVALKPNGRSKGFGFVCFAAMADAKRVRHLTRTPCIDA